MMAEQATVSAGEVLNQDMPGLHARINDYMTEVYKSQSSSTSQVTQADKDRITSYLTAVEEYHNWMKSQPELDLPETSPQKHPLGANPEIQTVENQSCNDLMRQFKTMRDELVNCQSSRRSSGIIKFDSDRLEACITKAKKFMTDYVDKVTPLDLPESNPDKPLSGHGQRGI